MGERGREGEIDLNPHLVPNLLSFVRNPYFDGGLKQNNFIFISTQFAKMPVRVFGLSCHGMLVMVSKHDKFYIIFQIFLGRFVYLRVYITIF